MNLYEGIKNNLTESSKVLNEQQIIVPENSDDGWGEDIKDLTTDFFDLADQVDYEIKNARRGSYGIDGTEVSDLIKAFQDIVDKATDIVDTLSNAEVDYSNEEDEELFERDIEQPVEPSYEDESEVTGRIHVTYMFNSTFPKSWNHDDIENEIKSNLSEYTDEIEDIDFDFSYEGPQDHEDNLADEYYDEQRLAEEE